MGVEILLYGSRMPRYPPTTTQPKKIVKYWSTLRRVRLVRALYTYTASRVAPTRLDQRCRNPARRPKVSIITTEVVLQTRKALQSSQSRGSRTVPRMIRSPRQSDPTTDSAKADSPFAQITG